MLGELVTEEMEFPGEARGCAEKKKKKKNNDEVLGFKPSSKRESCHNREDGQLTTF
jgi:hypothetical protein